MINNIIIMKIINHFNCNTFIFFFFLICIDLVMLGQNKQDYYIVAKQNISLTPIQRTVNTDGTLTVKLSNNELDNFFNNYNIYYFDKGFPTSITPYLQRVYKVTLDSNIYLNAISNRNEIEYVELTQDSTPLYEPNDYVNSIAGLNTAMELIKAPQTWNLTTGNPNIIVGIADDNCDVNHEDLDGQILQHLDYRSGNGHHGTLVAGTVAAKTDNGLGLSSIGFNTKLIVSEDPSANGVLELSQIAGVRIINTSWVGSCIYSPIKAAVYEEIWNNGVIVFGAAGNTGTCGSPTNEAYVYPASYDHVISVTSVGHIYPVGTDDPIVGMRDWKDVHQKLIGVPNATQTHNDKVDICAPGYTVPVLYNDDTYGISSGTSIASPTVAGVAALMLAVNPNLTPNEVKSILLNTADDIYHIPENQQFLGQLGSGRVNAYRAVLNAQCALKPSGELDLTIRNSNNDTGIEPDINTQYPWQSPDIWVRNQNDGNLIQVHQNPEYDSNNPNFVYVKVTNKSCATSTGTDQLKLYWAKANTALSWPNNWDGSLFVDGVIMGDEVGALSIPALEPGEEKIIEFEWNVPNPDDYININSNPWHFCLLSRIISTDDPMTILEGFGITQNVKNNNNIGWKNTTVVDLIPNVPSPFGGVIAIANPFPVSKTYKLELLKENQELGKSIYEEAEVAIEMDSILQKAWERGGKQGQNYDSTNIKNKKIVSANNVLLDNIQFNPNEMGTLYLTFNFLSKELTSKQKFIYHVIQKDVITNEIIGGETYEIRKKTRNAFSANAGEDEEINPNETISISAQQINEAAIYNWYDPEGNLIFTGPTLTVSPEVTQKFKLEIISNIDGYKDYDEVEVKVNPYQLESLVPNPAVNQITISYQAIEANSAYIMIVSTTNGTSNNYILNTIDSSITLDISNYQPGVYSVALICNGVIQTAKTLIKQ